MAWIWHVFNLGKAVVGPNESVAMETPVWLYVSVDLEFPGPQRSDLRNEFEVVVGVDHSDVVVHRSDGDE